MPVGTNLGLFHLRGTILSGRLLLSRGAVIAALSESGLPEEGVRRAGAALSYGAWQTERLLACWQQIVLSEGRWRMHRHGGYRPVAADLVGFFRPHRKNGATRHYSWAAGKALPAIVLGLLASVGSVKDKRLPLMRALVRAEPTHQSEADLQTRLLSRASELLQSNAVLVCDRGFPVAQLQEAGIER